MKYGDLVPSRRSIRQILFHRVLHIQFPALFQQQYARCGELLGEGAHSKLCRWGIWYLPFQIGEAITFVEQYFISSSYHYRTHELLVRNEGLDNRLHPGNAIANIRISWKRRF